jgi:hypothetical protein
VRKLRFLAVIVISALSAQSQAFSQDDAIKPSYKNGETWLYSAKEGGSTGSVSNPINGYYELSIVDGKLKIVGVNGSQREELDPRPASLVNLLTFGPNLNFPLTVGKQWDRHYKVAYYGSRKEVSRKITYEVKGIEQVTTTAGTFRAFRLESDDRSGPRDYWTTIYWYSPETKSIVKSQFDSTSGGQETGLKRDIELIKFTPLN